MRVELQPAYVLHTRPYRDTSLIVDFLTPDYGRVSAVARGVRQRKGNKRQLLNPFSRLLISWQGKTDLKLMTHVEADNHYVHLEGNYLYSGFYLNELLVRLLPEMDSHNHLFVDYEVSLVALSKRDPLEPILRKFELYLLRELGYALDFTHDARSHQPISPAHMYACDIHEGFFLALDIAPTPLLIKGEYLLAMAINDYHHPDTLIAAKKLVRMMLKPLLGYKPLKSRELFIKTAN